MIVQYLQSYSLRYIVTVNNYNNMTRMLLYYLQSSSLRYIVTDNNNMTRTSL